MISDLYLNRAVKIRSEYLSLNNDAVNYKNLINKLKDKVEETISELKKLVDQSDNLSEEDIKNISLKHIFELEKEAQRVQNLVDPINGKIGDLMKEEQILYSQIKINYPVLSEEDILKQIQSELKKRNLS
jgi:hypothetical protein